MKKSVLGVLIAVLLAICCGFAACSQVKSDKEEREKQLLAVKGKGGHYFISTDGYVKDGKMTYYYDIVNIELRKDGANKITLPTKSSVRVNADAYNNFAYFSLRYNVSDDNKQADVILGFVDVRTGDVEYFGTHISTVENYGIDLVPVSANANYFIFEQPRETFREDVYYVIDMQNNALLEKVSDLSPYRNESDDSYSVLVDGVKYEIASSASGGCKNVLKSDSKSLTLDYDYILERSQEMRKIDGIVGQYKREVVENIVRFESRLYVIVHSETGMFGAGELRPVVFEYSAVSDTFEYIGCTNVLGATADVLGVVPVGAA